MWACGVKLDNNQNPIQNLIEFSLNFGFIYNTPIYIYYLKEKYIKGNNFKWQTYM